MKALLIISFIGISSLAFAQKDKNPKNGKAVFYYPSETSPKILKAKGQNKNNQPVGLWEFYEPLYGSLDYTIEYQKDRCFKETYLGKTVIAKEQFKNDSLDSFQQYYNRDGAMIATYYYINGKPDMVDYFDPKTDIVIARISYHANGVVHSLKEYFPSGELKEWRITNEHNQNEGLYTRYAENPVNGQIYLAEQANYKNGLYDGELIRFEPNFQVLNAHFKDGKKHGSYTSFSSKTGKHNYVVSYDNDVKIGIGMRYDENGTLLAKEYWSGKQIDKEDVYDSCFFYRRDGSLSTISYRQLVMRENYPVLQEQGILFYPNGKVYEKFQKYDKQRVGTQERYYENGILQAEIPWKEDVIHGKMTFWYENGKKKLELTVERQKVVAQKGWDETGKVIPLNSPKYKELYKTEDKYGLTNDFLRPIQKEKGFLGDDYDAFGVPSGMMGSGSGGAWGNAVAVPPKPTKEELEKQKEKSQRYDKNAEPMGGYAELTEMINQIKRYPEAEKTFKKGSVFLNVDITVDVDGMVSVDKVTVSSYEKISYPLSLFTVEIERIFSHLPRWTPAVLNGQNVAQKRLVRITF